MGRGGKCLADKLKAYATTPLPHGYPPAPPAASPGHDSDRPLVPIAVPPAESTLRHDIGVVATDTFKPQPGHAFRSIAPVANAFSHTYISARNSSGKEWCEPQPRHSDDWPCYWTYKPRGPGPVESGSSAAEGAAARDGGLVPLSSGKRAHEEDDERHAPDFKRMKPDKDGARAESSESTAGRSRTVSPPYGRSLSFGLADGPRILPYPLSSPHMLPSFVAAHLCLLRQRVQVLDDSQYALLRQLSTSDGYLASIGATRLNLRTSGLDLVGDRDLASGTRASGGTRSEAKGTVADRGDGLPSMEGSEHRPGFLLPAYLYKLPFACSHCVSSGDATGCLVATASAIDFSRDVRDDYEIGLYTVVQLACLRAQANGVTDAAHWDILLPEQPSLSSPRFFRIRRLFARLTPPPPDAGRRRRPPEDEEPSPPPPFWWAEYICLNPAWTDIEPLSLWSLSRAGVSPHACSLDFLAHVWTKAGPRLPAWAAALGVPCPRRDRASDAWLQTLSAALSDPASASVPAADWARLRERYVAFAALVQQDGGHDSVPLPYGPHLRMALQLYRFGKTWTETVDQLLLPHESDGGRAQPEDEWLRLVGPADRPQWSCFFPRQSYWGSQIRLLIMQAFCDSLSAQVIDMLPPQRPVLVLEPYVQTEMKRSEVLAMPEERIAAMVQAPLDFVHNQFASSATDSGASKNPLFVLGYANIGRHWFAWQVCHKSRMVITYDGSVRWAAHDQLFAPLARVIDEGRECPTDSARWTFINRPLPEGDVSCGPVTALILMLCLRNATALQHWGLDNTHLGAPDSGDLSDHALSRLRYVQAEGLIDDFEEAVVFAEKAYEGDNSRAMGNSRVISDLYPHELRTKWHP